MMDRKIRTSILLIILAVAGILNWYDFDVEFDIVLLIFWIVFSGMLLIENEKEEKKDRRLFYLVPFIGFIIFFLERVGDYFN